MHELEKAVFECTYSGDTEKKGSFQVKNCERLKELIVQGGAFRDFCECMIENVPSLEVLSIGKSFSYRPVGCFREASLELRGHFSW